MFNLLYSFVKKIEKSWNFYFQLYYISHTTRFIKIRAYLRVSWKIVDKFNNEKRIQYDIIYFVKESQ